MTRETQSRLQGGCRRGGSASRHLPLLDLANVNLSDLLHRLGIVRFMRKAKTGGGHDLHSRPARNILTVKFRAPKCGNHKSLSRRSRSDGEYSVDRANRATSRLLPS